MTTADASARPRPRRVRPYPLDELPRLLRAQVELGRVLWRHLWALVDAAAISTTGGRAALEAALGGPLALTAQEPYLSQAEQLPTLLRGARLIELALLTPGQQRAVLAIDDRLCQQLGLRSDDRLLDLVTRMLHGAPVRVTSLTADDASALRSDEALRSLLILDLSVQARGVGGWARLLFSAKLRLGVAPPPSSQAVRRSLGRLARLDGVEVPLAIEAGYGFLHAREVLSLRPLDIVLLDHFGPKPVTGGPVWLRVTGTGGVFPGHLDGAGVTVLGSFHLRAHAMAEQAEGETAANSGTAAPDGSPPPTSEALLRELPVQITCEIGRVTLSAREVLELRPGAVVPVGRPLAGPVDLTAGGRIVARGELVDVEGEIGVRVTEVAD